MRDLLITVGIVALFGFTTYKVGHSNGQRVMIERVAQTEQALKEVLQHSSQTLKDLSQSIGTGDERDLEILKEIINAAPSASDQCRVRVDSLRALDAIGP